MHEKAIYYVESIKVFVKMKTVSQRKEEEKEQKKNKCNHLIDQKAFPFLLKHS